MFSTFINALVHLGYAALAVALTALASNATTIDPTWGTVIAALASVSLAWINDQLGKPAQQVTSLALRGKDYDA